MKDSGKTKRIAILSTDMTNSDIGALTVRLSRDAMKDQSGGFFFVSGFDDDPRELWDIPEVLELIDRLDSFGFMSALDCSVDIANFSAPSAFNAFHFWLLRTRQMNAEMLITREMLMAFTESLPDSNSRAEDTIARSAEWADGKVFIQTLEN